MKSLKQRIVHKLFHGVIGLSWLSLFPLAYASIPQESSVFVDTAIVSEGGIGNARALQANANISLTIQALGEYFQLVLEPNTELTKGMTVHQSADFDQASIDVMHFKGKVYGHDDSWVRLSKINGAYSGAIYLNGELYGIETTTSNIAKSQQSTTVMYRLSDVGTGLEPDFCGLGELPEQNTSEQSTYRALVNELAKAVSSSGTKQLKVGLLADTDYSDIHGANTAAQIQSLFNTIDGIYRSELGVTVTIDQLVIYTAGNDPFSGTTSAMTLLTELGNLVASGSSPVSGTGVNHLLSGRDFAGSTIGLAYVGTACDNTRYSTGLSQYVNSFATAQTLVVAHEIGHNLGASHDTASCGQHIMWPSASSVVPMSFSSCSKTQIASNVVKSCFTPIPDLTVSVAGPTSSVQPDTNATFTVTTNNSGAGSAANVTLTTTLPNGLSFVSASAGQGSCNASGASVTCSLGTVAAAAQAIVTIVTTSSSEATFSLQATVSTTSPEESAANNAYSDTVTFATDGNNGNQDDQTVTTQESVAQIDNGGGGSGGGGAMEILLMLTLLGLGTYALMKQKPEKIRVKIKARNERR